MQTISISLPVYGSGVATKFASDVWKLIKIEVLISNIFKWLRIHDLSAKIFQPTDGLVETDALIVIQTLIKTIYSNVSAPDENEGMKGLIEDICDECTDMLREPDRSQSKAAVKIISSLIQTTRNYLL